MAVDWDQFKPVDDTAPAASQSGVDWSQFKPADQVQHAAPAQKEPTGFVESAARGFKRSLPETKSLLYGATAAAGGLVGGDGVRDWGLENYQRVQREEVEPLANQSTFKGSVAGDQSFGEWAGDTLGNFGGQALQSLAVSAAGAAAGGAAGSPAAGVGAAPGAVLGAVGGLIAKGGAKKLIQREVGELVAEQVAKGVTREAAEAAGEGLVKRRLAQLGGGTLAGTGLNVGQEVGITYTGRADDARDAGEELTRGDALRAIGWGVPAGLVDTAAEGLMAGRLFAGASSSEKVARRMAAGAAQGAVTEGATEGVQAVMERAGAGQALTGAEAYDDYLENVAAGVLGGSVPGAASGIRRRLPENLPPNAPPLDEQGGEGEQVEVLALPPPDRTPEYGVIRAGQDGNAVLGTQVAQAQHPGFARVLPGIPDEQGGEGEVDAAAQRPSIEMPAGTATYEQRLAGINLDARDAMAERQKAREMDALAAESRLPAALHDADQADALRKASGVDAFEDAPTAMELAMRRAQEVSARRAPSLPDGSPIPDPTRGALSRAVNVGVDNGAVQRAADEQASSLAAVAQEQRSSLPIAEQNAEQLQERRAGIIERARQEGWTSAAVTEREKVEKALKQLASAELVSEPDAPISTVEDDQQLAPQRIPTTEVATASRYDTSEEMQDADIGSPSGGPFTIEDAAQRIAARTDGGQVFPVDGGFVVRTPQAAGGSAAPVAAVEAAAAEAATSPTNDRPEPTPAQKEAGNYKKGHARIAGLDIAIENPAGTRRRPEWPPLQNHYGYIKGSKGADKDHVDVFMTDRAEDASLPVFVVDQVNKDGTFDEHKVVMGAADEAGARATYLANYEDGWTGLGGITAMSQDEFKAWVRDPKKTARRITRPVAEAPPAKGGNQRRMVSEAPNGIKVGDRVEVSAKEGRPSREPYEARVVAIEINAPPVYGGTAFKVARDNVKSTAWVGIDQVKPIQPSQSAEQVQPPTAGNEGLSVQPTNPPAAAPAKARKSAAKTDKAGKPMDLLRVIAASGGLNREAWGKQGVDPAEFTRRAGFQYVFRKQGGMTPSDLREFMQQEGYLAADHPDMPATVEDNDAVDLFDRAFRGGEEIFSPDQQEAVARWREAQQYAEEEYRENEGADAFDEWMESAAAPSDMLDAPDVHDLLARAEALGATQTELLNAGYRGVQATQDLIDRLEKDNADSTGSGASDGEASDVRRPADTGTGGSGLAQGRPGAADEAQASGGDLFGRATAREEVEAERRRRDAERDGRTGSGRTDMLSGGGELFAGPRPAQVDIEQVQGGEPARAGDSRPMPESAEDQEHVKKETRGSVESTPEKAEASQENGVVKTVSAGALEALGAISEGGWAESVLRGLSDADARAAAKAMGLEFAPTAQAVNIASTLGGRSQPEIREAAGRGYRQHATDEQRAAREASRPARHAARDAELQQKERDAELRRRERNGQLGRENGEPFKNDVAARKLLNELPATGEFAADGFGIYRVEGGFVLRRWETTGFGATDPGYLDQETARSKRDEARAAQARERGMEIDEFGNYVEADTQNQGGDDPESGATVMPPRGQQLGRGEGQRDPGTLYDREIVEDEEGARYVVQHARHWMVRAIPMDVVREVSFHPSNAKRFNLRPGDTLEPGENPGPLYTTGLVYDLNTKEVGAAPVKEAGETFPKAEAKATQGKAATALPRAVADGLAAFGYTLDGNEIVSPKGKNSGVTVSLERGRAMVRAPGGKLLWSGKPERIGDFPASYWHAERVPASAKGEGKLPTPFEPQKGQAASAEKPAAAPASKATLLAQHSDLMGRVRAGTATPAEYQQAFEAMGGSTDALVAELSSMTKDKLLEAGGRVFAYRYKSERKGDVVDALAKQVLAEFALGRSYGPTSFMMSANGLEAHRKAKDAALRELVANTTEADLKAFADEVAQARAEVAGRKEADAKALADPQTLADFNAVMRHHMGEGSSYQDAYLQLSPEQRQRYDELAAETTREARDRAKAAQRPGVAAAGQSTTGQVIETKHTKHGHDLFVVQLGERVSREDYDTLNASARRMGGSYSSYRANGAVPGFQFKTREAADAFSKLVAGDTADAVAVADARRDAFQDDRSQSAVQRLRSMADALQQRAESWLNEDRKVNTARRARAAAAVEKSANQDIAQAKTMQNLANAIEAGNVKFLDAVRQKVQVEFLAGELRAAKGAQVRAKYASYREQEENRSEPVDAETVDFATFPSYGAMRSDLAGIARQMLDVDGLKKLGARLLSAADDVSDAYTEWAKQNLLNVSRFGRAGELAEFRNRDDAERAIRRAGLTGRAIVLPIKRGQNRVVLAPSEAMKLGLWDGDGDKRITLTKEFGQELVEAIGRRAGQKIRLPWGLENTHQKRKRLEGMGIFTAPEYRSALREFAGLQEAIATPDKIKEMERSMVGRRNDGLDFFPTSAEVVDTMLAAAEIEPGMAVLEPSAGMGHIADAIRNQAGVNPDVVELSGERRELLEAKGYHLAGDDFLAITRRGFTYGDVFRHKDGTLGVMRGSGGMGSDRVGFQPLDASGQPDARLARWEDREDLTGAEHRGMDSGYDRIVMNPPFSKGRDIQHVRHAYDLLRPGGRLVAIMGEGAFFQSNKNAESFRTWLDDLGATSEKLPEGSFMDPALPVNTGVNARMVVIDKPAGDLKFSKPENTERQSGARTGLSAAQVGETVGRVTAEWRGDAPKVQVVQRAAELPERATADPEHVTAEGFYDDATGTVYLVADNLRSPQRALQVLAHEAVGHYGIEAITGEKLWQELSATVDRMRASGKHAELFAEIDRRYQGSNASTKLSETIAVMTEKGVRNSVVDRVVAAVRQFLRGLGFQLQFTDAELRQHIVAAARHVQGGSQQPVMQARSSGELAFSRTDIDPKREVPVVNMVGGVFGDPSRDLKGTRNAARDYLRKLRDTGNKLSNDDTGWKIGLSGVGIRELTNFDPGKLGILLALPRITKVAVLARTDSPHGVNVEGGDRVKAFHTFYAPVRVNSDMRVVRLVVREDANGNFAYDLQQSGFIEKGNPPSTARDPHVVRGEARQPGGSASMTVAQLRDAVNAVDRPGWQWSKADPVGGESFARWFGGSQVVTAGGQPKVVYHGTADGFWSFDKDRLSQSTGHMSAPLGFFFAEDKASAEGYARKAADGVPADERVIEAFLSIERPFQMSVADLLQIESRDEAVALREVMQRQGYDGIHITDAGKGQWIAFEAGQIKSATENVGTFDRANSDMRFSKPDPTVVVDTIDARGKGIGEGVAARLKDAFRGLKPENLRENTRPAWLGALTLRHLAELGGDLKLKQVGEYADLVQRMATDRNVMQEAVSETADNWEKFQRKDRAGADATSNLMHDTTIEGVDPSKDYAPLRTGTTKRGADEAVTRESIARRKAAIAKDMAKAGSPEARTRLEAEAKQLDELLAQEQRRREQYPELVRRFLALPEAGQKLYREVRDAYEKQSERMEDALVSRIDSLEIDGKQKAAMVAQVRQQFESAKVNGPYFPLQRFGQFWISAESPTGDPAFMMYERVESWREAQRDLQARGFKIKNAGVKLDEARSLAGASGGFMADLQGLLETSGVDKDTRDEVYQLYLRTLPDLSVRKHQIHRKATTGYSNDALRAFSSNMFHGSFQIARLRHSHELDAVLLDMKQRVESLTASDPERAIKAGALYSEMNKRHEWVMNPRDSKAVSSLTSIGFAWYLGATPAAALVNLTQTAIVAYPVLAARFGAGKAFTMLSNATGQALRNVTGDISRSLTDEERAAYQLWREAGTIDKSQAHNLAGLSETDTRAFNPYARRAMEIISWGFHRTEVVNREATALAAFRLARESGQSFNDAVKYAGEVVTESHFDYSNANRARFMQSNAAKVLLLFRQYSLNMTWFLWRNLHQSLKGESPEVKKEARTKLAGVLGMTGVFAGAMGMPLMSVMFGVANAAAAAFGDDDDEPFDAQVAFRNFLADMLGPEVARILAKGPVDYLTGANISGRVSLNDLWLREPNRELEGKAMANYLLEQAAGPLFGGMLVNTLRGMSMVGEGHTWRGIETMMPKAVKDGMKALRYSTQGVNTIKGDPIIEDLGVGGSLLQLAGFSPASLNERYDGVNAAKNYEQKLLDRRSSLLNAYAMAWRAGDADTTGKVLEKIRAFNQAQPALAINGDTIRKSLQARLRYSSRAEGGVVINPKIAAQAREQARFAQ